MPPRYNRSIKFQNKQEVSEYFLCVWDSAWTWKYASVWQEKVSSRSVNTPMPVKELTY